MESILSTTKGMAGRTHKVYSKFYQIIYNMDISICCENATIKGYEFRQENLSLGKWHINLRHYIYTSILKQKSTNLSHPSGAHEKTEVPS